MQLDYIYNYCEINLLLIEPKINLGGRATVYGAGNLFRIWLVLIVAYSWSSGWGQMCPLLVCAINLTDTSPSSVCIICNTISMSL